MTDISKRSVTGADGVNIHVMDWVVPEEAIEDLEKGPKITFAVGRLTSIDSTDDTVSLHNGLCEVPHGTEKFTDRFVRFSIDTKDAYYPRGTIAVSRHVGKPFRINGVYKNYLVCSNKVEGHFLLQKGEERIITEVIDASNPRVLEDELKQNEKVVLVTTDGGKSYHVGVFTPPSSHLTIV